MISDYRNTSNCMLHKIYTSEEILKLALTKIAQKKGEYYELIQDYILNYDKINVKIIKKIKTIIIFLQEYTNKNGEKVTMKNLKNCLDKLGTNQSKNTFSRLFSLCVIYNESTIINTILNNLI